MKTTCLIDENGYYSKTDVNLQKLNLSGKNALDEKTIEDILKDMLLYKHAHIHSYPYDWRTKKPVIIRSSQQWFIDTSKLKERALEVLKDVKIRPQSISNSMVSTLSNRPYWCISRQRVWGLPIPCLYTDPSTPIIDDQLIGNFKKLIQNDGNANFWWSDKYDKELNATNRQKSKDILDIWFDSGSSFNSVLNGQQADLYCEGVDQFSGWFQASLLLSVALNDKSPYKSILVHGFVVDDKNRKMSKSLGNIIEPVHALKGFPKKKIPQCGNDVLRFWVLSEYHKNQIPIGSEILEKISKRVFEIRSIIRFLVGNINGFNTPVDYEMLLEPDKYLLHKLELVCKKTVENYEDMNLNRILIPIENFLLVDVSGFYIKSLKDRLYCEPVSSHSRLSAQTVIQHTLEKCLIMLAPIMPHLTEEAYRNSVLFDQKTGLKSFFQSKLSFKNLSNPKWMNLNVNTMFEMLNIIKNEVNSVIKSNNSALFDVDIKLDNKKSALFGEEFSKKDWLVDFFSCSSVKIEFTDLENVKCNSDSFKYQINVSEAVGKFSCPRCRRYINDKQDCLCERCSNVIKNIAK